MTGYFQDSEHFPQLLTNNFLSFLSDYFPNISRRQTEQFAMLGGLYAHWNKHINVISRKDIEHLYERHVQHSLAIAKVISFADNARIVDVGTGGGFPGIPLAILFPNTDFLLVDSISKKLKVVNAVTEELDLNNVTTKNVRAENISEKYDFIVSRAVAPLSVFIPWLEGKLLDRQLHDLQNGMFFLKGGDLTDEMLPYREKTVVYNIGDFFDAPFFNGKKILYIHG